MAANRIKKIWVKDTDSRQLIKTEINHLCGCRGGHVMKLTDESPMPRGKYKGEKMANVPAEYLLRLYDNDKCSKDVNVYIKENYDILEAEIAAEKRLIEKNKNRWKKM